MQYKIHLKRTMLLKVKEREGTREEIKKGRERERGKESGKKERERDIEREERR